MILFPKNLPKSYLNEEKDKDYHLFCDVSQTDYKTFNKTIRSLSFQEEELLVLFFSDAGAWQGNFNIPRIEATKKIIDKLRKVTSKIAWLNPVPQDRWEDTTAEYIQQYVFMQEANSKGIKEIIRFFRGKLSIKQSQY